MSSDPIEPYKRIPSNMPLEIEKIYLELHWSINELVRRWKMYDRLYIQDETVTLLNESAPSTFALIQNSLIDNILLIICRLGDPAITLGHENLSIEQLKSSLSDESDSKLKDKIGTEFGKLKPQLDEARNARNKRIAHSDLESVYLNKQFPIKLQSLQEILAGFGKLLNFVEEHFDAEAVKYLDDDVAKYVGLVPKDEDILLYRLGIARKHINRKTGTPCCC